MNEPAQWGPSPFEQVSQLQVVLDYCNALILKMLVLPAGLVKPCYYQEVLGRYLDLGAPRCYACRLWDSHLHDRN